MRRWPFVRWRRYRAYYHWWRRDQYRRAGFDVDPKKDEDEDERPFWVEEGRDDPFSGKSWDSETAVVPR